jgi:hypothetical protein
MVPKQFFLLFLSCETSGDTQAGRSDWCPEINQTELSVGFKNLCITFEVGSVSPFALEDNVGPTFEACSNSLAGIADITGP